MSTTIESLELEIVSNSKSAVSGIDALTQSLGKLKSATGGSLGLTKVVKQLNTFNGADVDGAKSKMVTLSAALSTLSTLPKANLSGFINPLMKLPQALAGLSNADMGSLLSGAQELATALQPLAQTNLEKSNLSGYINSLAKIPSVLTGLNKVDMSAFATKIQEITDAIKPLATEMEKVANGFSAFPTKIQRLLNATNKVPGANKKAGNSFTDLFHVIKSVGSIIGSVATKLFEYTKKASDYTENMNLFTVSMGKYAQSAYEYATQVQDALGIDTSEWMRSQGVFMTMAKGFGIAGDRASAMSQNLTQLGYDIASFYNLDTETAMLKLKSGLAGELEPLRAIGYDLSQAKLEATALELGISKSVSSMTQAEKAQLRYYAIMTQVTDVHGDMARTIEDPANQLRRLKSTFEILTREIGNLFIPILQTALPILTAVLKVLTGIVQTVGSLLGIEAMGLKEGTTGAADGAQAIADNLEEGIENAKALTSHMLGFDELNVIDSNSGLESPDTSGWVDFELPTYKFVDAEASSSINAIVEDMKEWLGINEEISSWTDLISTNFGNILVAAGLIGLAILGWKIVDFVSNFHKFTIDFASFGTILKGLGIGTVIAIAIAGATWLFNHTEDIITKIGAIISGAALAVGGILAFSGINIPLGIALMAVGAVAMGSAIALNTNALSDEVKGVIAVITAAVSVALLAIGGILAFTGVNIPLGIALLAGGALTLATAVIPNWNYIADALKGPLGEIVAIVSGALLVLGAILLFTGVGIPLGLGLIFAGAAGLGTVMAVNWDFIVDKIKGIWNSITRFWDSNIAPVFTAQWWINLGKVCINGLISGFEGGVNGIISMFEDMVNWIIDGLNKISIDIPDWLGGGKWGINLPKVSLGRVSIPRLADGAFDIPTGQMFIAREAGAEMVGSIGRKTAVANNDQIVEGIAGGVAEANTEQNALLREQNELLRALLAKDNSVYLDGRTVTGSVEKYQRERGRVLITGGVL